MKWGYIMDEKIILESKGFIGKLRKALKMLNDDNLFVISIKGTAGSASSISVATYDEMKVGSLAREKLPSLYKAADKLMKVSCEQYKGITSVIIMLTDEFDTEVFQDGQVLRICNLDA